MSYLRIIYIIYKHLSVKKTKTVTSQGELPGYMVWVASAATEDGTFSSVTVGSGCPWQPPPCFGRLLSSFASASPYFFSAPKCRSVMLYRLNPSSRIGLSIHNRSRSNRIVSKSSAFKQTLISIFWMSITHFFFTPVYLNLNIYTW